MIRLDQEAVTIRETTSRTVQDLSDKLEETKLSVNKDLEALKINVHQHGLEVPRKLTMLNAEVDIHTEVVGFNLSF